MRLAVLLSTAGALAAAQPTAPTLSSAAFEELALRCAPGSPLATLRSIATVESSLNPFALSINYPEAAGTQLGIGEGSVTLARQPGNLQEAVRWSRWFLANGQTVSVGLMQLNIEHLAAFKIPLEKAFDPCTNIKLGWSIFSDKYAQASAILGKGQLAIHAALSAYNSGSLIGGFRNGYVEAILRNQQASSGIIAPLSLSETRLEPVAPPGQTGDNIPKQESAKMLQTDLTEQVLPSMSHSRTAGTNIGWDLTRATAPWVSPRKD